MGFLETMPVSFETCVPYFFFFLLLYLLRLENVIYFHRLVLYLNSMLAIILHFVRVSEGYHDGVAAAAAVS